MAGRYNTKYSTTAPQLPPLRDDQAAIVAHPAQTKTIAMGRRWGKTFMAGVYALTVADYGGAAMWLCGYAAMAFLAGATRRRCCRREAPREHGHRAEVD